MADRPAVIFTIDDWADALEALPLAGPLPQRLAVVPNQRVAHALRRRLLSTKRAAVLAGTRFVTPMALALERLPGAKADAAELAPHLVRERLSCDPPLEVLEPARLLEVGGWDEALSREFAELEREGVDDETLQGSEDTWVRDVGALYAHVREALGESLYGGGLLRKARGARCPRTQRMPALVVVTGFESTEQARFLESLPLVTRALWVSRPARAALCARCERLHGPAFADALREASFAASDDRDCDLGRVATHLFQGTAPAGPPNHDGTLRVVTFAGADDEVEAAADWVTEQVLEHNVPLSELAVLSPQPDVYGPMLVERLARRPWPEGTPRPYVVHGLPVTDRADGARLLVLLRALESALPREGLAALLPLLKLNDGEGDTTPRLSPSDAARLVNTLGMLGGSRSHPEGAHTWWFALAARLAEPSDAPAAAAGGEAIRAAEADKTRRALAARSDALRTLFKLAEDACDAPMDALCARLVAFADDHLRLPVDGVPAQRLLQAALAAELANPRRAPHGLDALELMADRLLTLRVRDGRFGEPRLYIGSLESARALPFRAVRVLGLAEGSLPSAVREDAVLSDARRTKLSPALADVALRAERQLAGLGDLVRHVRDSLVLSAPRVGAADTTQRQPAAVLLDVLAAAGEPPDEVATALRLSAREHRNHWRRFRTAAPLSDRAHFARACAKRRLPARFYQDPAASPDRIATLLRPNGPSAQDGVLPSLAAPERLAGLRAERPISASRLLTLLRCPHWFLLDRVLYLREPTTLSEAGQLDQLSFGSLVHRIVEAVYVAHGLAIGQRSHDLAHWQEVAEPIARDHFDALAAHYPLGGASVVEAQWQRVRDAVHRFVRYDWDHGRPREFVAAERGFGYDAPLALPTPAGELFVHGNIDRLDKSGRTALVRDVKSGAEKPRRPGDPPELDIDLQLGLYAAVAAHLRKPWELPAELAVAYVYLGRGDDERCFEGDDYTELAAATERWLTAARAVLSEGTFLRTADANDCRYCPYTPLCPTDCTRNAALIQEVAPAPFAQLKLGPQEDDHA